jgi:hypothetical protein
MTEPCKVFHPHYSLFRACALALLTLLIWVPSGRTDVTQDDPSLGAAKTQFSEGINYFAKEDYPNALAAFEHSYRLVQKVSILYNIAMCQKALYRYVDSMRTFRQYLALGEGTIPEDKKANAKQAIVEMAQLLGRVHMANIPPDTDVYIDGKLAARSPLKEPLALSPGRHIIRVTKDGFEPLITEINVASQGLITVQAPLKPLGAGIKIDCGGETDATIRLDGKSVGLCPLESELSPGTHKVEVIAPGKERFFRTVKLSSGGQVTISVHLEPKPAPITAGAKKVPNKKKKASPLLINGIVSFVTGAGLTAMGVVYQLEAIQLKEDGLEKNSQMKKRLEQGEYNSLLEDYNKIRNTDLPKANVLTAVGYGIGGALMVTGIVLWIINVNKKQERRIAARPAAFGLAIGF